MRTEALRLPSQNVFLLLMEVDTWEPFGLLSTMCWTREFQLMNVGFELDSRNVVSKFHNLGEFH